MNECFAFSGQIAAWRPLETVIYLIYEAQRVISVRITPKIVILRCKYDHQIWSDFRDVVKVSIHSIFEHGKVETLCEDGSETFSHFLALKKFLSQKNFFHRKSWAFSA